MAHGSGNCARPVNDPGPVTAPQTPRLLRRQVVAGLLVAAVASIAPAAIASAHTETDLVAVPAGSTATVTFEPEHGCGDSPTVDMKVQAPVAGATALDKAGWQASSVADETGNTVLEWSGGSQPSHEQGAFQVRFTVPDEVGTLLAFPAVQTCANGEQETWIETEPGAESPAPQLLVLAAGSQPAATIADVPAGAPGRDQLAALAAEDDDDAAAATTTPSSASAAPATSAASGAPATSTASAAPATSAATATTAASGSGGSSAGWVVAAVIAAVVVIGVVVAIVVRRRGGSAGGGAGDSGEQVGASARDS
jgi:periplasmic copper chaperone A